MLIMKQEQLYSKVYRKLDCGNMNEQSNVGYQDKLSYPGHTTSKDGQLLNDEHIAAICHAPSTCDATSFMSFLGLTVWYFKNSAFCFSFSRC